MMKKNFFTLSLWILVSTPLHVMGQCEPNLPSDHLLNIDPYLKPFKGHILNHGTRVEETIKKITNANQGLTEYANGHLYFGLHKNTQENVWHYREWLPNATKVLFVGPKGEYPLTKDEHGNFSGNIPLSELSHGDEYFLKVYYPGGEGLRMSSHARWTKQDPSNHAFSARVWDQPNYLWKHEDSRIVATYKECQRDVLPYVKSMGFNTIQLMAIMEHPFYGSFGYHVGSFYAPSSRFGTPDDLRELIDSIHGEGLNVVMDLVHSHSVKNIGESLNEQDGSSYQYFHKGPRGDHKVWDSKIFDYGKPEVLHFLLSNLKYWLDEFHFDGFRFDGVTSMLYHHHGIGTNFNSYHHYFNEQLDHDAITYLTLANKLIHDHTNGAISIAEDVSGYPGIAYPSHLGGLGFDFRLAMGQPDYWVNLIKNVPDRPFQLGEMFYRVTDHRPREKEISYVESHDQALVGDQTLIFRLLGENMYTSMRLDQGNTETQRAFGLVNLFKGLTFLTSEGGSLTFMGNEFGHPEWIDFPRQGNGFSHDKARRLWFLKDDPELQYQQYLKFDQKLNLFIKENNFLNLPKAKTVLMNQESQFLILSRGDFVMAFNFSPEHQEGELFNTKNVSTKISYPILEMTSTGEKIKTKPVHKIIEEETEEGLIRQTLLKGDIISLPPRSMVIYKKQQDYGKRTRD
jgi:1,4-alpha-glucan branching enzyme